jgi:pantothenate kinase
MIFRAAGSDEGHKVALDGYHLGQAALEELGLAAVKGAPHTFDAAGYVALLRRLKESPTRRSGTPRKERSY